MPQAQNQISFDFFNEAMIVAVETPSAIYQVQDVKCMHQTAPSFFVIDKEEKTLLSDQMDRKGLYLINPIILDEKVRPMTQAEWEGIVKPVLARDLNLPVDGLYEKALKNHFIRLISIPDEDQLFGAEMIKDGMIYRALTFNPFKTNRYTVQKVRDNSNDPAVSMPMNAVQFKELMDVLTHDDHMKMYANWFLKCHKYDKENIVCKVHPRDNTVDVYRTDGWGNTRMVIKDVKCEKHSHPFGPVFLYGRHMPPVDTKDAVACLIALRQDTVTKSNGLLTRADVVHAYSALVQSIKNNHICYEYPNEEHDGRLVVHDQDDTYCVQLGKDGEKDVFYALKRECVSNLPLLPIYFDKLMQAAETTFIGSNGMMQSLVRDVDQKNGLHVDRLPDLNRIKASYKKYTNKLERRNQEDLYIWEANNLMANTIGS